MTILEMPDMSSPTGRVAAEVRGELGRRRISTSRLARDLESSQSYWDRRVRGIVPFDVEDLQKVADYLGLHPARFLGGWAPAPRPDGPGGGAELPHLDSNQKPIDLWSRRVSTAAIGLVPNQDEGPIVIPDAA